MDVEKWSENELRKLERNISKIYKQAHKEMEIEVDHYYNGWVDSDGDRHLGMYERKVIEWNAYERGIYTEEQFNQWWASQEGRGNYFRALRDQYADRMVNANLLAVDMINKSGNRVFAKNANSITNIVEKSAIEQGVTGIRFDIIDEHVVNGLITGETQAFKKSINIPKDTAWNQKKLTNELTRSILRGESYKKLADRFQNVANMNRATAIRNARTSTTCAQSAGKQYRYNDLTEQGVEMTKIWVATYDTRTRDAHMEANGQEVKYDEPFLVGDRTHGYEKLMYPADSSGSFWNICNCRCTMKTGKIKFKSTLSEETRKRANIRVV